jgi:hypothetical protein
MLLATFGIYVVASLWYIYRLRARLNGYEHVWHQIESIADKNQDGQFVIDIQHLEEATEEHSQVHANNIPSGVRLLHLDGMSQEDHQVA